MDIQNCLRHIERLVICNDWVACENALDNAKAPNGDKYVQRIFQADSRYFEDTEDALCRMLISQISADIQNAIKWNKIIDGKTDKIPQLFWRFKPQIEGDGLLSAMYARYVVTMI